jgi:hypothetical protein
MKNTVLMCAILTLTSACGGAVSVPAQTAVDPIVVVPLRSAIDSLTTKGLVANFSLSGTTGGITKTTTTGNGTISILPSGASIVNGVSALTSTQELSGSQIVNGVSTPLASKVISYFSAADISRIVDESSSAFTVYDTFTIPATLKVGDSGSAWGATIYKSRSQVVAPGSGRVVAAYSAAKDAATSLLVTFTVDTYGDACDLVNTTSVPSFCIANLPSNYVFNVHTRHAETVYRISTSGTVSVVSIRQDAYGSGGLLYQSLLFSF